MNPFQSPGAFCWSELITNDVQAGKTFYGEIFGWRFKEGKVGSVALVVLCMQVDENPATRNHLWILAGMIVTALVIEIVYRRVTGRKLRLTHRHPQRTHQ